MSSRQEEAKETLFQHHLHDHLDVAGNQNLEGKTRPTKGTGLYSSPYSRRRGHRSAEKGGRRGRAWEVTSATTT
jgi:hypothetical protein